MAGSNKTVVTDDYGLKYGINFELDEASVKAAGKEATAKIRQMFKEVNDAVKENANIKVDGFTIDESKARKANADAIKAETNAKIAAMNLNAKESAQVRQLADDWKLLNQAYADAANKYKNFIASGNSPMSEQAQVLLKDALAIKQVINTTNEALGNYQHKVGQYTHGINAAMKGVGLQTMQLMREMPNLAMNAQTFILSLSNNLPYFFEAIQMANVEIKKTNAAIAEAAIAARAKAEADALAAGASKRAAAAAGEQAAAQMLANQQMTKAPSIWKMLGASIFGVQGLLMVGVTLFTLYGSKIIEWVGELFKGGVAMDSFSLAMREVNRISQENINLSKELTKAGREYLSVINDSNSTYRAQVDAYAALQQLYKGRLNDLDLEAFKLKNSGDQQKYLNQQVDNINLDNLRNEYKSSLDNIDKLTKAVKEFDIVQNNAYDISGQLQSRDNSSELRALENGLEKAKQQAELLKNEITRIEEIERVAAMTEAEKVRHFQDQLSVVKQNLAYWESTHGALMRNNDGTIQLKNNLHALTIAPLLNQYNQLINRINTANRALGAKSDIQKERERAQEELDKLQYGGFGSIAMRNYWAGKVKSADKKLEFYDPYADDKAAKKAQSAADKASRLSAAQSRKAEAELNRQNALKQKYLDLQNEINESAEKFTFLEKEENQINQINDFFDDLKRKVEQFNADPKNKVKLGFDEIEKNRHGALAAYNAKLKRDAEKKALEEDQKWYEETIKNYSSYLDRKKNLQDKYDADVERAKRTGHLDLIPGLTDSFNTDLAQLDEQHAKTLIRTNRFFNDLVLTSEDAVRVQIENIRWILENASLTDDQRAKLQNELKNTKALLGKSSDERELQQLNDDLAQLQKQIRDVSRETPLAAEAIAKLVDDETKKKLQIAAKQSEILQKKLQAIASLSKGITDIGQAISDMAGESQGLQAVAGAFSAIGSNLGDIVKLFDKEAMAKMTSTDAYVAAANALMQMVSGIINAAAQRKAKLQEFYNDITSMQNAYNLALIEEIRIREGAKDSVFFKAYSDKVTNGLASQLEAVKKYNAALQELQKASVKTGTMKKTDWEKTAKNTVSGAAAGAYVGSLFPGIGTAVGAIVGGVVGFVSGLFSKKRVDIYSGLLQTYPDLLAADGKLNKSRAQALLQGGLLNDQSKQAVQNALNLADAYEKAKEQIEGVISELAGQLGNDILGALVENYKQGGKEAGQAFLDGIKPSLAKISQQLLFEALFGESLKNLQEEIKRSFQSEGTDGMARIIADWGQRNKGLGAAYVEGLKAMDEAFKQAGYENIYGLNTDSQTSTKSKNSLSGAYAQASQESIDLLSGHTMGMKVAQLKTNEILTGGFAGSIEMMNKKFEVLLRIDKNTGDTVTELKSINSKMNNNVNNALAAGVK